MQTSLPLAETRVAYFSMEIALDSAIPTYAGGLGILAGDMLRSAADLGLPLVGITLVHHKGYFRQRLDASGDQRTEADEWNPADLTDDLKLRVQVTVEGRTVRMRLPDEHEWVRQEGTPEEGWYAPRFGTPIRCPTLRWRLTGDGLRYSSNVVLAWGERHNHNSTDRLAARALETHAVERLQY